MNTVFLSVNQFFENLKKVICTLVKIFKKCLWNVLKICINRFLENLKAAKFKNCHRQYRVQLDFAIPFRILGNFTPA